MLSQSRFLCGEVGYILCHTRLLIGEGCRAVGIVGSSLSDSRLRASLRSRRLCRRSLLLGIDRREVRTVGLVLSILGSGVGGGGCIESRLSGSVGVLDSRLRGCYRVECALCGL